MSAVSSQRHKPVARWVLPASRPEEIARLATELGVSRPAAQCLANRGIVSADDARLFLSPRLSRIGDPFELPDLRRAAERLWLARARGEAVLVFGDYDVDGICSVAILTELFGQFGIRGSSYLPRREEEGYGMTPKATAAALEESRATLFIAVDCGSSSPEAIGSLQARGVDVIVLDHHQISDPAPAAFGLVNPRRAGDGAGRMEELCSAGLAFKFAHGFVKLGREKSCAEASACDVRLWLDFVALGIVADLVPVTGENRPLLCAGLQRLNQASRPGLAALAGRAGIKGEIGVYEIAFQLAPRLNAAGRLESAGEALRLLLTKDPREAETLAGSLNDQNRSRQEIERKILSQAMDKLRAAFDPATDWVIVEGDESWHIGVVGIVAARVMREFHRPAIILGGRPPMRGSGRSIAGFDLGAGLRECADLLLRHGGHAMAAGVTIDPARLDDFRRRLNRVAKSRLTREDLLPAVRIDIETPLSGFDEVLMAELDAIGPFGQGNPPVHHLIRRARAKSPALRMGGEKQHAKLVLGEGDSRFDAVWWNAGASPLPAAGDYFDLVCVPEFNTFRGETRIQLRVLDWRAA
jgi:single-stranded-DNA-specific exonuclease